MGRTLRRRWRQSFVLSVSIAALLGFAVFSLLIGRIAGNEIEEQAVDRARQTSAIVARSSFAPRLPSDGKKLANEDLQDLDRQLAAARASEPGLQMRLWGRDRRILYSGDRGEIGGSASPPPAVTAALGGRPATAIRRDGATDTSRDASLTTAVPVRRAAAGGVAAALELRLPYAPIGRDIGDRTRRLQLALLVAGLLAYALVLPALIRAGRAVRAHYDPRRVALMRELSRAMKRGELQLRFHPIADASSREVHTAEALLRWEHPQRGQISPDRFIPLIEPTELMWPLTLHIFELVVKQAREWVDQGVNVRIAINVSTADVIDPRLPDELIGLLRRYGVGADRLEIEVTEGAVMSDADEALTVLGRLTDLGLGVVAIDDFGTGYSSLARLHELPVDELKIDQSFVMRMARDGDETVVRSIIELAHALRFRVIAEGVEDEETWSRLVELGCDYVQGYVMTQPLPAGAFTDWLDERELLPAS